MPRSTEGKEGGSENSYLLEGLKKSPAGALAVRSVLPGVSGEAGAWGAATPTVHIAALAPPAFQNL